MHEGLANLYADFAEQIVARLEGRAPDPLATTIPSAAAGLAGLLFIKACLGSAERGTWQAIDNS